VPDEAARRFVSAIESMRPAVETELDRFERERQAAAHRDVARELRRALRGLSRRLPQYALPEVAEGDPAPREGGKGEVDELSEGATTDNGDEQLREPEPAQADLFPPGPLASVTIVPSEISLPADGQRRVHAVAADRDGRALRKGIAYQWRVDSALVGLRGDGPRPALFAASHARIGATARIEVTARTDDTDSPVAHAEAAVTITEEEESGAHTGVPEPRYVSDPAGSWRSRFDGRRWEVNDAHEDFVTLRNDSRARVRYLLTLFAKEIALRTYGHPGAEPVLEALVEVLAHAERNLRGS
jgi:hypothetical protein